MSKHILLYHTDRKKCINTINISNRMISRAINKKITCQKKKHKIILHPQSHIDCLFSMYIQCALEIVSSVLALENILMLHPRSQRFMSYSADWQLSRPRVI